jgi:gamma-tubulin complex component 3
MFEVLEVSWSNFSKEMEAAKDLDDLLAAHEKYLNAIVGKSLLGEQSQTIRESLFVLFELILRFRSHADRLYEGIHELQIRSKESGREKNKSQEPGSWISEGRKGLTQRAGEFLQSMSQDMDSIAKEYTSSLDGFLSLLPLQQSVDLKFLFFRLDFTEFYSRLHSKG